jgi:putative serine protease PepD
MTHGQQAGPGATSPENTHVAGPEGSERPGRQESGRGRRSLAAAAVVGLVAGLVGGGAVAGTAWAIDGSGPATTSSSSASAAPVDVRGSGAGSAADVEQVAKAVTPSVVLLKVQGSGVADEGSGVVLSANGMILTNNHVVEAAANGGSVLVEGSDGKTYRGMIVGRDPVTDLAVVRAVGEGRLTPASIGQSATLEVGQPVIAIGAPLGLQGTVTTGIVSALDRPIVSAGEGGGQSSVTDAIQTDAAINPGNSGGPLVDAQGQVVGINSSIASLNQSSGGSQAGSIGLGFAIPIDEAMRVAHEIEAGNPVSHAQLGVSVSDSQAPAGARIGDVTSGSAAGRAGLQSGDVVTRVDGQVIDSADGLVAAIRTDAPGDTVTLTYVRGGSTHTAQVVLGSDQPTT